MFLKEKPARTIFKLKFLAFQYNRVRYKTFSLLSAHSLPFYLLRKFVISSEIPHEPSTNYPCHSASLHSAPHCLVQHLPISLLAKLLPLCPGIPSALFSSKMLLLQASISTHHWVAPSVYKHSELGLP